MGGAGEGLCGPGPCPPSPCLDTFTWTIFTGLETTEAPEAQRKNRLLGHEDAYPAYPALLLPSTYPFGSHLDGSQGKRSPDVPLISLGRPFHAESRPQSMPW